MEYLLIRNAYKAPVKRVFDYIGIEEYRNPKPHQKKMLDEVCDGVEIFKEEKLSAAKNRMKEGDYLYESWGSEELKLVCIYPPKK